MDKVMMTTHTASLQGFAAPTWLQPPCQASQRFAHSTTSHTLSPPKQTRRSRCFRTASAFTASQDTVSVLSCTDEHNLMVSASPCTFLPQHAADAATIKLEDAVSHLPQAKEQQPDVLEVLTQQLAEQHIPFCFPSQPLTPAPRSELSTGHLTQAASSYLLDRYLQDVPACTTPLALSTQEPQQQASPQCLHHKPITPDRHSVVSQPLAPRHQQHLESKHLHHAKLASCVPTCKSTASACSQHQTQAQWTPAELCQLPQFVCMQELVSRTLLESHRCRDSTCQSAEVLRLQSSKGQTWKGLALRQAFMGQALGHLDDEASVQDAAGGGGLLHGGAEDGGEGGGPSRGWGGAAGEDGDAEEDEDEEQEDEDEDQDDDEDQHDSSSEDSQAESDWTSSAQSGPPCMQRLGDLHHAQGVASSVDNSRNVCSCSQWLHQSPHSKQQIKTASILDQQDHDFYQNSPAFSCGFDLCTNNDHAAAANKGDTNAYQQQVLASSVTYRTTRHFDSVMSSESKQQDHVLRREDLHVIQKRSGVSIWKEIPDFAIRLCINVLGSCL